MSSLREGACPLPQGDTVFTDGCSDHDEIVDALNKPDFREGKEAIHLSSEHYVGDLWFENGKWRIRTMRHGSINKNETFDSIWDVWEDQWYGEPPEDLLPDLSPLEWAQRGLKEAEERLERLEESQKKTAASILKQRREVERRRSNVEALKS